MLVLFIEARHIFDHVRALYGDMSDNKKIVQSLGFLFKNSSAARLHILGNLRSARNSAKKLAHLWDMQTSYQLFFGRPKLVIVD
jgi:hypothetical protein